MIQNISLTFESVNVSAQVGDVIYYSYNVNQNYGGFDYQQSLQETKKLGTIISIEQNAFGNFVITVQYDSSLVAAPNVGAFISFAKDKKINTSSLLGYYMQLDFANDSKKKIELFSVGSEVAESSK